VSDTQYQIGDPSVTLGELGNAVQYPLNRPVTAYTSSLIIKPGPGILYGFTVYNSRASAQFILLFDANTVPADSAIPVTVFTVGASSQLPINFVPGRAFNAGIVICNSSTGPTKTIGSADCWFDAQYL
jgi:hypothetical protein